MKKLFVNVKKTILLVMLSFGFYLTYFPSEAHAIIVLAPVFIGLTSFLSIILTIASLPTLLLSVVVNIDSFRRSKLKFALLTVGLWILLLGIIGIVSYLYYSR